MDSALWDTLFQLAQQAIRRQDWSQAIESLTAAVEECNRSKLPPNQKALCLNNLAAVFHQLGRVDDAIDFSEQALFLYAQVAGINGTELPLADISNLDPAQLGEVGVGLYNLAELYLAAGRLSDSESAYLSAQSKLEKSQEWEAYVACTNQLANFYLINQRLPEAYQALKVLNERQDLDDYLPKEEKARVLHTLSNLGDALSKHDEADALRQRCLELLWTVWSDRELHILQVLENMLESCLAHQRPEAAEKILSFGARFVQSEARIPCTLRHVQILRELSRPQDGIELLRSCLENTTVELTSYEAQLRTELGLCYFALPNFELAETSFSEAISSLRGETPSQRIGLLYNLAAALQGQEKNEDAIACYSKALALAEEHLSAGNSLCARIVWNYSQLLEQSGHSDQAAQMKSRFVAHLDSPE
jgi:tetratricopeptide (TPR) repeat protein